MGHRCSLFCWLFFFLHIYFQEFHNQLLLSGLQCFLDIKQTKSIVAKEVNITKLICFNSLACYSIFINNQEVWEYFCADWSVAQSRGNVGICDAVVLALVVVFAVSEGERQRLCCGDARPCNMYHHQNVDWEHEQTCGKVVCSCSILPDIETIRYLMARTKA